MSRILGIGVDLVELERLDRLHRRYGEALIARFCLPGELEERQGAAFVQHLGGLFAAKEAVLKALGSGWARGLGLRHIEIARRRHQAPEVRLHRAAEQWAAEMGVDRIHISITHERAHAIAFAILEGD